MTGIKNINKAEVMALKEQVEYQDGQVVSKTLAQNEHVSVTLFSSCQQNIPMRYMDRNSSRCCW